MLKKVIDDDKSDTHWPSQLIQQAIDALSQSKSRFIHCSLSLSRASLSINGLTINYFHGKFYGFYLTKKSLKNQPVDFTVLGISKIKKNRLYCLLINIRSISCCMKVPQFIKVILRMKNFLYHQVWHLLIYSLSNIGGFLYRKLFIVKFY